MVAASRICVRPDNWLATENGLYQAAMPWLDSRGHGIVRAEQIGEDYLPAVRVDQRPAPHSPQR